MYSTFLQYFVHSARQGKDVGENRWRRPGTAPACMFDPSSTA